MISGGSLIKIKNKVGPRIELWETIVLMKKSTEMAVNYNFHYAV